MSRAGWVRAEELTIRSSWGIVVSSVLRRPYPEAPVSSLFLFGSGRLSPISRRWTAVRPNATTCVSGRF